MNDNLKKAVEEYQCPGCVTGSDISCYENASTVGSACSSHCAGTRITPYLGRIFLGMPKGFNRLGESDTASIIIFNDAAHQRNDFLYDKLNVPVWKYKNSNGDVFVRGLIPRLNNPFLHIIIGGNIDSIDCLEITQKDIEGMD